MKHIKLYEEFNGDSNLPDLEFYDLTDGNKLFYWEEPFEDMGGETNYYVKYKIGKGLDTSKETKYEDIKNLLKPNDRKEHDEYLNDLYDANSNRSDDWVK